MLFHREGAAAGDLDGVLHRLWQVGEQHRHVLGRLEVVLRGQAAAGLRLVHIGLFGDADQRVMGLEHVGLGEIHVIGGHQRQGFRIGQVDQPAFGRGLGRHQLAVLAGMALQFDVEPGRKGPVQAVGKRIGLVALPLRDQQAQRTGGAAGQADQTLGMGAQLVQRHMRQGAALAQIQTRRQRHQVQPARLVLGQQNHGPGDIAQGFRGLDHDLAADDGLDALFHSLDAEFQRREQGIRVGQRHRGHAPFRSQTRQLAHGNRAFQQGMFGMRAKVDESGGLRGHARLLSQTVETVQLPRGAKPG